MWRHWLSLNITQKFIGYLILLSFLPLLILGISSYRFSSSTLRNEVTRYTAELVTNQQDYLNLQIDQIESLIANISGVEEITNALGDENASNDTFTNLATQARIGYILNGYSNLKGLVSIDIFTTNGDHYHVGDTLNVDNIRNDVKDRIFAEALESNELVYWAGIEDNVNANSHYAKVVTAAKVLTRVNRTTLQPEPVALIIVNYSVEYLYEHFNSIEIDEGAYLMVVDTQKRIMFHPDKTVIGSQINGELKDKLFSEHEHRSAMTAFELGVGSQRMLINHLHSVKNGWVVMSFIPVKTLAAKIRIIGITTVLVSIMSLGIAGLAAWLISKNVVTPIRQITNQFKRFQDGSLDQQIRLPVRSKDEIGELVQWFNVFVESLATRQKMERALQERERQYRGIFEAVTDGLMIINEENIIVTANSAACRMHGYTDEEFVELRPLTLIHTDYRHIFTEFLSTIEGGQKSHASIVNVRQDGTVLNVEIHGTSIDYQGQPHQLLIIHDITERVQTEEAMRRTQKLESLGVLAGGIAHDFNNLLVAMMAQTSLALVKLPPGSDAFPHIDKAVKAAEHAADLTRQMLAYSGRGQFEQHSIDLNKLLEENLHLLQAGMPKHVKLVPQLATPLPLIEGDQGQMQQVVMNLIINAAEAIDPQKEQGQVLVKTGIETLVADDGRFWQYTGSNLTPGHYVTLEVQDNGCGMDDKTMSKIFDPFFTTKFTGRGLGLAAVQGIVRGHRGGLHVASEIGRGTTFTLLFPASADQAVAAPALSDNGLAPKKAGAVLVIDDETAVRDAVADILALEDIKTITATDGAEGVARYREHQEDIRLVILDLSMPGLSGEETFAQLKKINPDARVLISSGYSQNEVSLRFANQEGLGFLQKPYKLAILIETVREFFS